jgi:hypothetical protein
MRFDNATKFHRKSGVAQWRDLRFLFRFSRRLFSPALPDDPFRGSFRQLRYNPGLLCIMPPSVMMVVAVI